MLTCLKNNVVATRASKKLVATVLSWNQSLIAAVYLYNNNKHHYQGHKPATRRNVTIKQDLFLNMAAGREDRHHGGRTKWTDKMCIDLISCREQSSNIYSTDECPRNGKW